MSMYSYAQFIGVGIDLEDKQSIHGMVRSVVQTYNGGGKNVH